MDKYPEKKSFDKKDDGRKPYKGKDDFKKKKFQSREDDAKQQIEESKLEQPAPQNTASINFPSLTLVNTQLLPTDGQNSTFMFSVLDVAADPLLNSNYSLLIPLWDEFIRAYATARGYTSATTGTDVRDAINAGFRAYASFLALLRAQNAKNIRTQVGQLVGRAVTDFVTGQLPNAIIQGTAPTVSQTLAQSISNASWVNDYVQKLSEINLPDALVRLANQMYSVAYAASYSDMGSSSVIQLIPSVVTDPISLFNTNISTLTTLFTDHPDLRLIMQTLGYNNELIQAGNYQRDLNGETYTIVNDEEMIWTLYNGFVLNNLASETDTDIRNLWFKPKDGSSIFAFTESTVTDVNDMLALLLRGTGNSANQSTQTAFSHAKVFTLARVTTGIPTYVPVIAPFIFADGNSDAGFSTAAINPGPLVNFIRRLTDSQSAYELLLGIGLPFASVLRLTGSTTATLGASLDSGDEQARVLTFVSEGASAYKFSYDEFQVLNQVVMGILVHGATWRQELMAKARAEMRQASNIGY